MHVGLVIQAILLGILQGLTEFLPISSSAHLILFPWLLGWESIGLDFDVILHGGTLLAVVIYFRRQWKEIGREALGRLIGSRPNPLLSSRLLETLILATLPAAILGAFTSSQIDHHLRNPKLIAGTLSGFALLLAWADRRRPRREVKNIRLVDGLVIGLAQALALMPGVSRSGVTITAALMLGYTRTEAAYFSFLLAAPIISLSIIASTYNLLQLKTSDVALGAPLLVGIICSLVSGFLCIKYFLRFLQRHTYLLFVVYRLLLASFILALLVW